MVKSTKRVSIVRAVIAYLNGYTPTTLEAGTTHALSVQLADSLVTGGFARFVADAPPVETAAPQNTAQRIALAAAQQRRNRGGRR